jgi:type VII secretion protein EccB
MTGLGSLRHQWLHRRGSRLLWRRLECAVLGRSPSDEPALREQRVAFQVGIWIAVVMLAVGAGLAFLRPAVGPGAARLVMLRDSGALFVRVNDRWHPVPNIASARLILGSPDKPRLVDERELQTHRGAPLGIPGAPYQIGPMMSAGDTRWTVCDDPAGATTVAAGSDGGAGLDVGQSMLVASADGPGETYLLYDGKRALIDADDRVVARTLGIADMPARRVSTAVLNLIPEVAAIAVPEITALGQRSRVINHGVGSVLRLTRAQSVDLYVVLRNGLQRIGPVAADLVRYGDRSATADIIAVSPDEVVATPLVDELAVGTYPDRPPTFPELRGELCVAWSSTGSTILVGPDVGPRLRLAHADDSGPALDFVAIPAGRSVDVVAAKGTRYLITDTGVCFAVHDSEAAAALGLGGPPVAAPRQLLSLLPTGPELSRPAASIERYGFAS